MKISPKTKSTKKNTKTVFFLTNLTIKVKVQKNIKGEDFFWGAKVQKIKYKK